jgi:hypothetical protein
MKRRQFITFLGGAVHGCSRRTRSRRIACGEIGVLMGTAPTKQYETY